MPFIIMSIDLYIDYISQPSRAVLAFCRLSNIPVTIHQVRVSKMQHLSEDYAQINPMKKVPAIIDGPLRIGESHAIIDYLIQKHHLEQQWGWNNLHTRAKVQEYLHYHHTNTRKCAMQLFSQLFSKLYPVQGQNLLPSNIAQEVEQVIDFLEEHYFKDSVYMISKMLTPADLAAYFQLQSLQLLDYDYSRWPKVQKWLKQMGSIEAISKVNGPFSQMAPKMRKLRSSL